MSVLIRGMEMPTRCEECPIFDVEEDKCGIIGETNWIWADDETCETIHPRPDDCPLISAPPHGGWIPVTERLPDAFTRVIGFMAWEAITAVEYQYNNWYSIDHLEPLPREAVTHWMPLPEPPTIIEAEGEE